MKLPSGVKDSGPLVRVLMPAPSSAGTRTSACSMSGSKWSQSDSSSEKTKPSGMPSSAQDLGFSS